MGDNIKEKVLIAISRQTAAEVGDIKLSDNLKNDYRFDSLDEIEMVMEIEEEFDIQIYEDEIKWVTVSDVIDYMIGRMK